MANITKGIADEGLLKIDNLNDYPYIAQWITYHGEIKVTRIDKETVEVAMADAGGIPEGGRFLGATIDDALNQANLALPGRLAQTKKLLNDLISGELKTTEYEYLCVAGWPAVKNPFYCKP